MLLTLLLVITFIVNIPCGYFRENYKKMSWQWFAILHASIPIIFLLRRALGFDYYVVPILIIVSILGQLVGAKKVRQYIKKHQ